MPFDALDPSQDGSLTLEDAHDLYVLREIARRLREPGTWLVARLHGPNGKHCAIGWLRVLTSEADSRRIAETYLVPAIPWWHLHRERWDAEQTIWQYNDWGNQARVAALFERAARRLERSAAIRAIPMHSWVYQLA